MNPSQADPEALTPTPAASPTADAVGVPTSGRLDGGLLVLIGICSIIYLLDGLIHSILGPLAPQMAASLHLSSAELGPIFSSNLVGQCIGLVVLPLFVPRLGERGIVLLSLVGFGLAQSGSALADGATSLIVWRLVTGVFLGGCLPSCLAIDRKSTRLNSSHT